MMVEGRISKQPTDDLMRKRVRSLVGQVFAITLFFPSPTLTAEPPHNIIVHVVEATTGKPLARIAVNLRLGNNPGRKTLQQITDSQGTAYFYLPIPLPEGVSVDAFSLRYSEIQKDPEITSLPQAVTIPVRHLSFIQSLHLIFVGD